MHESSPLVPVFNHVKPIQNLSTRFNFICPSTLRSYKWSSPFMSRSCVLMMKLEQMLACSGIYFFFVDCQYFTFSNDTYILYSVHDRFCSNLDLRSSLFRSPLSNNVFLVLLSHYFEKGFQKPGVSLL